ncbi:folate family ECF transporter S component [Candidatus Epulonipiscium viviparus]|uniref:folate family ECF transporter S component n=1 Tax=Candidatus Epulonipiscium viviparus TaxID=420336 RepID=UPI0004966A6D|nr:folate family ECF transporter S component [Candidatus Epulopiscium viviparus]
MKLTTKQLTILSLLIAIHVVLSRHLAIHIGDLIRISFASVVTGIIAVYFKPAWTILACGISDLLAALLFPTGPFFPGFTLSAMVGGSIYAALLYRKPFSWYRVIAIKALSLIIVTAGLNSYWLSLLIGKSFIVIATPRIAEELLMFPIEVILLGLTLKYLVPQLKKQIVI